MLTALVLQLIQCVVILPENLKNKNKETKEKEGEAVAKDKINVRLKIFLNLCEVVGN